MKRKEIKLVVDYIARNYRCTFPAAWDTGEGIQAPDGFGAPSKPDAQRAIPHRDRLVEEIKKALDNE